MKYPIEITINNINESPIVKTGGKLLKNLIKCKLDWNTNTEEISDKKILIEYYDEDLENIKTDVLVNSK